MPHPLIEALLAAVDPLPYPRRMKLLAVRARELARTGELDSLLVVLRGGDDFEREIGLFLAEVAGQIEAVKAYLDEPNWRLRQRALTVLIRTRSIEAGTIAAQLTDAPAQVRRQLSRGVRAASASDIADALVDQVRAAFGDAEAARLLPACSADTVARLLPELGHQIGNWAGLARRHPLVVLAEAERQLAELSEAGRVSWWDRHGDGVLGAGEAQPHAVLDVLERFAPATHLPGDRRAYGVLAVADRLRVLALFTAPERVSWLGRTRLPRAVLDRFGRLDSAALVELARRLRDPEHRLAALLDAVPPSRRGELYDAAYAGVVRDQAELSPELLDVLPRQRRIVEARRILGLGNVRDSETRTLEYTAHLDWREAEPALSAAVSRGEPEERALAWELMLACAARTGTPGVVTEVIGRMRRLRNEQDPVRSRALSALAEVQPWLIEPDTAETLRQIATDAMQARDSSSATVRAVSDLGVAVLRQHFGSPPLLGFAQHALHLVFGTDRMPHLPSLDTRLRRGQEAEFFAAVRQWLQAGIEHGEYQPLLEIARALGRRAWGLPELQSLLEQAVLRANVSPVVRRAITEWLADPTQRSIRVEQVLDFDSSTVALEPVWDAMSGRRTDLLDRVLSGRSPEGRFLADGVRWVPPHGRYARRWLPRQRRAYVDLLAGVVADAGIPINSRTAAIAAAARVGGSGLELVERYVDSPNVNLAEAALAALAWTERPAEALPILLSYVDTERARVAMYAVGRAAGFVAPSRLHDLLVPVALGGGKVTSRKEALRLLARSSTPGFGGVLREAWLVPEQHRDVRAAVVSTARQRLDDASSWQILVEASEGDRYDVRALVRANPFSVAAADRTRYAGLVARACAHADREAARTAWSSLAQWTQWTSDLTGLLVAQLTDLADRSLWPLSSQSLISLVRHGAGTVELSSAIDALLRLDAEDPTRDDPELDRPAYHRLVSLVDSLVAWSRWAGPQADRRSLVAAGRHIAAHADRRHLGARLLVHSIRLDDTATLVEVVTEIRDVLASDRVPVAGVAEVSAELSQHVQRLRPTNPAPVFDAAQHLAARDDLAAGLVALGLAEYGAQLGWPPPWRDLVRQLRRHEVADVRLAALNLSLAPK
jgi:hypothetical protein